MPSHYISSKLQKKWHFSSIFHSQFADSVDFKNDTRLSLHQQIMASTCKQNPNLPFFSTALSCWKGRDHFCLQGKTGLFFSIRNWNNFKNPQPQQLGGSWPVENISSQKLFEAQAIFCKKQKKWIFFAKNRKKSKKGEPLCFGFLHLQTWPKGTEDCSTVSGVT